MERFTKWIVWVVVMSISVLTDKTAVDFNGKSYLVSNLTVKRIR